MDLRTLPTRLATGAFILHSGLSKRDVPDEAAAGLHGMAKQAYPFLGDMTPQDFARALSVSEIAVGSALLAPFIPTGLAGLALTGFGGALLGMYFRTPGMRKEGSIWPTPNGTAVAKDAWLVGIGLGLVLDALTERMARLH